MNQEVEVGHTCVHQETDGIQDMRYYHLEGSSLSPLIYSILVVPKNCIP